MPNRTSLKLGLVIVLLFFTALGSAFAAPGAKVPKLQVTYGSKVYNSGDVLKLGEFKLGIAKTITLQLKNVGTVKYVLDAKQGIQIVKARGKSKKHDSDKDQIVLTEVKFAAIDPGSTKTILLKIQPTVMKADINYALLEIKNADVVRDGDFLLDIEFYTAS